MSTAQIFFKDKLPLHIQRYGVATQIGRSPLMTDLLELAGCILIADRMAKRRYEHMGSRHMIVHIPMRDPELWKSVQELIERILGFLTEDKWTIVFNRRKTKNDCLVCHSNNSKGKSPIFAEKVALFSGGLDSTAAAAHFASKNVAVCYVSWYVRNRRVISNNLAKVYHYFGISSPPAHALYYVRPSRMDPNKLREHSRRSRSFLFCSLALITAIGTEASEIAVCENGPLALNLPIDESRIPTRHAHSLFLSMMTELSKHIFPREIRFYNPYELETKGEMCRVLKSKPQLALSSTSCWNQQWSGRGSNYGSGHCGYCLPCLIRLASLKAAHIKVPTDHFDTNIASLRKSRSNSSQQYLKRETCDSLLAFAKRVNKIRSLEQLLITFPFVIETRPTCEQIEDSEWFHRIFLMMKRFAREILTNLR